MLPSTGYFKAINCPFYDSGLCERPYCHFRHVKKDNQNANEEQSGAILQKLVSAAVQKVLQQQTDVTGTVTSTSVSTVDITKASSIPVTQKATYNPTPISELNKIVNPEVETSEESNEQRKRHIPVPYTPRKPASLPIARPVETNGEPKPFIYIPPPITYTPGCTESITPDPYLPKGSTESSNKYLPGTETVLQEYTPKESLKNCSTNKANYVPSDKNNSRKKLLEYKPAKLSTKAVTSSLTYQPTPRSLVPCFSSDEDEPDPKKRKLSSDLNGLDELGAEFDMLDQILDEEKSTLDPQDSTSKKDKDKKVLYSKDTKENKNIEVNSKTKPEKKDSKKSHDKSKGDKKDTKSHKEKTESASKSSHNKSSHKSSSKDKEKYKDIEKDKPNKDKHKHEKRDKESKKIEKDKESSRISLKSKSSKSSHSKNESSLSKSTDKPSKQSSSPNNHSKRKSDSSKSQKSPRESREKHKSNKKEKEILDNNSISDDGVSEHNNDDLDVYKLSESDEADEDAIALECKRIFEAYVPQENNKVDTENCPKLEDMPEDYIPVKKRISRTADSNIKVISRPALKPDYKKNAAQSMADRLAKVREFHAAKNMSAKETNVKTELPKNVINPNNSSSKIRIAHVPYASTLLNAKKVIPPTKKLVNNPSTSSTIAQTLKKGDQRVAHMPSDKFIDRPGVLEPLASKIPANIRSTYLNMMIDECLKIYELPPDAYSRAQNEELNTSKKCTSVPIYKNSAVLAVNRLRKELQECKGVKKSGIDVSNDTQTKPNNIDSGSWSIENKNRKVFDNLQFSGSKLYNNIKKWILTEKELQDNGFPRPHPGGEKGRAIIYEQRKQNPPKGYLRTCCRCKKEYTVDKNGLAIRKEECIYHPNNKYKVRGEARYQCCSQDSTSDGCCMAPSHVYEYVDYNNLKGYVKTLPPESTKDDYGVYSLDCEMCYTTHGLDLTRVTVINSACKVIYETLIKPFHPIIDYNTRYSGITEEQMAKVNTSLIEVQATLLSLFNSKTILIGHSLESDFKALKLIHDTVIDTSVLFPHKMGPPYKRALRNLSSEHLKKIIQNSVDGHDSAEDALVCMELIHFKLKEDLKTR